MENKIKLTKYVSIASPYNRDFKEQIKTLDGAAWNSVNKTWMIPESKLNEARKIMNDTYGYDDLFKASDDNVNKSKED